EALSLHAVPAMALGLAILIVLDGVVAVVRGGSKPWRVTWAWLCRRESWLAGGMRLALLGSVLVLFYQVERWRGRRAWTSVVRELAERGESTRVSAPLPEASLREGNVAELEVFAPLWRVLTNRSDLVGEGSTEDLGALSAVVRWDLTRHLSGPSLRRPRLAPWVTGDGTDFRAWLATWPSLVTANPQVRVRLDRERGVRLKSEPGFGRDESPRARAARGELGQVEMAALVLELLNEMEPVLAPLREAGSRTECFFPLDYGRQMWRDNPALPVLNGLVTLFRVRASALLVLDRPDEAWSEIDVMLRVVDYARQQPWAVRGTQRLWVVLEALQPIYEGVRDHRWTADQLTSMQSRLEALDLLADYAASVRNDAVAMADNLESFIPADPGPGRVPLFARSEEEEKDRWLRWVSALYPRGWSLQDQAAFHRYYLDVTSAAIDLRERVLRRHGPVTPGLLWRGSSDPLFALFLAPKARQMFEDAHQLYPAAQTAVDLAAVACAMERHRLTRGVYPTSLNDLIPQFLARLPRDVVEGGALRLSPSPEGVTLYSVGWDGDDDGGQWVERGEDGFPDFRNGDWVWGWGRPDEPPVQPPTGRANQR
ncbi:MAG: hypothetical protein IT580_21275, partial [Verrucomicrobiales bacterium]|nr:hypothetical protein [Verrucomicrobiales bacterium]